MSPKASKLVCPDSKIANSGSYMNIAPRLSKSILESIGKPKLHAIPVDIRQE